MTRMKLFLINSLIWYSMRTVMTQETSTVIPSSPSTPTTSETYEFGDSLGEDLRSIAYFLRQHKFNEYDRRYITNQAEGQASKSYFAVFPKPPLRSLHWEVHKFCEPSFLECVAYLIKRIRNTALRRNDDTSVVIEDQKWFNVNFTKQVEHTDSECRKLWAEAEDKSDPFQGPLERFQWRVTASYFMCSFTMKQTPELRQLNESSCDNHANCLNPYYGAHNKDPRANDSVPFNCARYSFCPDPCCPIYHMKSQEECWGAVENPCTAVNEPGHQKCSFDSLENAELHNLILNRWNVSCECPYPGYRWSSLYGLCIDIDECEENTEPCNILAEACLNLPGTYRCVCKWGYSWNPDSKKCEYSELTDFLVLRKQSELDGGEENVTESYLKNVWVKFQTKFSKSSTSKVRFCGFLNMTLIIALVFELSIMFNT